MYRLQSGNDHRYQSYFFPVTDASHTGEVRRFSAAACGILGFSELRQARVSIIINELCSNLLKYSHEGHVILRICDHKSALSLEILAVDHGPGIADIAAAMADGFSTGTSPGTGLGAVKRLSDVFDIYSHSTGLVVLSEIHATDKQADSSFSLGAVSVPLRGETVSGDAWCVEEKDGDLFVFMADGLGHGPLANFAAIEAVNEFKQLQWTGLEHALACIDQRLKGTRGAAVFLAHAQDKNVIEYLSAGNVRGLIQTEGRSKTLISQNGTAGLRITKPKIYRQEWDNDDLLIFHTDGVKSNWDLTQYPGLHTGHPSIIAAVIYRDFHRDSDDATILVVRRPR